MTIQCAPKARHKTNFWGAFFEEADLLGTAGAQIQRWVKRCEHFDTEGLLLRNGSYTGEFKINVIECMHTHQLSYQSMKQQ